jgi:hypothetical protein
MESKNLMELNNSSSSYRIFKGFWNGLNARGPKWHLTSQFAYFAFRTIVMFGALLSKKFVHKKEFSNEIFCVFIIAPIFHMFLNQFWINNFKKKCIDFAKFCVSSWKFITISNHTKNVNIKSSLVSCIISYNFSLNNMYIASHLHVVKDSWTLNNP